MLKKITVSGQYLGTDKRGTMIGGVPFLPGMPARTVEVTEDTYHKLVKGSENGWFKIVNDNYALFCTSRKNALNGTFLSTKEIEVATKQELIEEAKVEEIKAEEVNTEVKEEVETKKATKKTTKKAKAEQVEEKTENEE